LGTGFTLIIGSLLGFALLILGIGVGAGLARLFDSGRQRERADRHRVATMLVELSRWTDHVSSGVIEHREVMEGFAEQIAAGLAVAEDDSVAAPDPAEILAQILEASRRLHVRLETAEAMLKQQSQEIASYMSEARTDALTQLSNRRVFDESLAAALTAWRTQAKPVVVLMMDIDHFKRLNDTCGHPAGDAVLMNIARLLREHAPKGSIVARYGGEEFAAVMPGLELEAATAAADRVRTAVDEFNFVYDHKQLEVTISCGLARALHAEDAPTLIRRSDDALYAAKHGGRNRVFYHDGYRPVPLHDGTLASPEAVPESTHHDFHDVCRDLRSRLEQVVVMEEAPAAV
jgi:diguanylate cyclase